ncbi:MAG: phosphoenolpyruvate--protein phosphotransferase [Chlorobiaceae bacterium]|nr:phosphoenolpyruvate--protein phosphotransferase [Chlorobiaceae bacterium]MBA4308711.1 phosphoenolpyruvate--protein phosphotransferase [Chlorobiaceae bacterium]
MKGFKELLKSSKNVLQGIAAAPGMVIGKAYVISKETIHVSHDSIDDPEEGIKNLNDAISKSKKELNKVFGFAKEKMGTTRAAIFEAQLMILDDPILIGHIKKRIREEKKLPEFIVDDEISKYQRLMIDSHEHYMRERATDIEDIKNRIIKNLQQKRWESKISKDVIVVSDNLTPADTILFTKSNVKAYLTDHGGLTSHAAIIARALNVPAIVGLHTASQVIKSGDTLIVNGFHGYVFVNPSQKQIEYFENKISHLTEINSKLNEIIDKPSETLDNKHIQLLSNVDVTGEIDMVIANRAEGIGLFRTEQVIEELGEFPDENEQTRIYTNLANRIYPDSVTIRVFDIGGDKVKQLQLKEQNPFLGLRGIRFLLENQSLFKTQIRAILKASIHKNILIMIPMVSTIQEINQSKEIIESCKLELMKENIPFDKEIKIGIMIEVPSAAVMTREYASIVDFISVGTNDLIQYLMAVDRGNDIVAPLYQEFHPAVLRTLSHIFKEAKSVGTKVSLCGEMASDTLAVPVLIGLGLDSFSISPSTIPYIKKIIRSITYKKAKALAEECLTMSSEEEIVKLIEKFFKVNSIQRTRNIL